MPTGLSRQTLVYAPYPFFARRGDGAYVEDVDGRRYLDLVNNYTSLIHGHSHSPSRDAAFAAFADSPAPGAPTELELQLAEEIAARVGSIEWLRFALTGSEAVLFAVRAARAFTGRQRILKFEGGFHGSIDELQLSITQRPMDAGTVSDGLPATAGLGVTRTVVAVYNDLDSVRHAFAMFGPELAGVIVEPFLGNGGLIKAEPSFMSEVQRLAREHGTLLILDEIQSYRLAYGGAQSLYEGLEPDLTTMGKTIGGGLPLALLGGRKDAMDVFDGLVPQVRQTGTFTAFPPSLAAGLATLRDWGPPEFASLNDAGARVRARIGEIFSAHDIPVHVSGQGSMFGIAFTAEPVRRYEDLARVDEKQLSALHHALLTRNVYVTPRGAGCLSTPMTDRDLDFFSEALDACAPIVRRASVA